MVRKTNKTSISVIIPTKDRIDVLLKCIDSITNQSYLPDEIIIIDSSKTSVLKSILNQKFGEKETPRIKHIHSEVCLAASRNLGIKHSSGDIIFFFDDDVILDKNYIKEIMGIFLQDEKGEIAGITGDITNAKRDTKSWRAILQYFLCLGTSGDGKFRRSGYPTFPHGINRKLKVEFLSGCDSVYRRKIFNEFKFDEKLGKLGGYSYNEDVDFSYRVSKKYTLIYTPYAKLEHYPTQKKSGLKDFDIKKQLVSNHFYLFKKNIKKSFLNMIAFMISIYGILITTVIFERSFYSIMGCLQGLITVRNFLSEN